MTLFHFVLGLVIGIIVGLWARMAGELVRKKLMADSLKELKEEVRK